MIRMMIWEESQKGRNLTMAFISFDGSSCLLILSPLHENWVSLGSFGASCCQLSTFVLRSFEKTGVGEIKIRSIETSGTDQAWKP